MRYIEFNDKNGNPIFEGDSLILTIKDKFWGSSYFGKFCSYFDIDTATIDIIPNAPLLCTKIQMKFFKDGNQVVTNKEEAYWNYLDNCQESNIDVEKTIDDMVDVSNPDELNMLISSDSMFFSYICGKGLEKVSGFEGEAIVLDNSALKIENKLGIELSVNDSILLELDDKWHSEFNKQIENAGELALNKGYTHVVFKIKRIENQFNYSISGYPCDKNGNVTVFEKDMNEKGKEECYRLDRKLTERNKENEKNNLPPISDQEAIDMLDSIYENEDFFNFKDFRLMVGFNNEIKILEKLQSEGLKVTRKTNDS